MWLSWLFGKRAVYSQCDLNVCEESEGYEIRYDYCSHERDRGRVTYNRIR